MRIGTDGACSGNPGRGGWAAVLTLPASKRFREISGCEASTTNNRMELVAVIEGLKALKRPCEVEVVTDSKYVVDGFTKWLQGWIRRGWRKADGSPVQNADLWRALLRAAQDHKVTLRWVKGHASDPLNHRADELAVAARKA